MRYLTVRIDPRENGGIHPVGGRLTAAPAISREAIHSVELLDDGTILLFAEGSGDRDRYEAITADSPHVIDALVSGTDPWFAVSQFEPSDETRRLLELRRESNVSVELPIRVEDDGALRATFMGNDADIQALYRTVEAGSTLSFDVVETGSYDPADAPLARRLTRRQRDVVEAAVELGYYAAPREATLEDVADRVGIAASTAGEHLRKAEARVFTTLIR
ncbi:DNA binding protein [Halovivax asiaticus JCM 14624]|uniref:DNA binding protein n=1 Tax=Halovivax asiaticus JCM 14624 TaxID=1227490 RepID=M0BJT1_9EURY|nr:helix-turn-helix domain-containing protein [Halovivax asiaticus]ELZ11146.1 DNA binding protein [Halovivax asiaticus JCM 14624]